MINLLPKDGKLIQIDNFFDSELAYSIVNQIINETEWKQEKIKMYGKELNVPRLTAWYGNTEKPYTYSGIKMLPNQWTPILLSIKNEVEKLSNESYTSVLLNYYRDGNDSVSWHQDNEKELGLNPTIASLSFGADRIFKIKHIDGITSKDILLKNNSLIIMSGEMQHKWKHCIPKTKKKITERINLTFRKIA